MCIIYIDLLCWTVFDAIVKVAGKQEEVINPIYMINIHSVLPLVSKLNIQQECSRERLHYRHFCSPLKASLRFPIFKTIDGQLL